MEDPRILRELAGWYRDFAEGAGNPEIGRRASAPKKCERNAGNTQSVTRVRVL